MPFNRCPSSTVDGEGVVEHQKHQKDGSDDGDVG